jgi:hypothetical protein
MSNRKLQSDTMGIKDVVKLDLPQDKKESVFTTRKSASTATS